MNDLTTIWDGAEANSLLNAQLQNGQNHTGYVTKVAVAPSWKYASLYKMFGLNLFVLRLPGVMILVLSMVLFFFFAQKIFGHLTTIFTLLVLASSLLIVNIAKFAASDIWLFGIQLVNFVTLILYLKQPILKWKIWVWITLILGILIHPVSMLVWSFGLWGYLHWKHPKGRVLKGLYIWLTWLICLPILYLLDAWRLSIPSFYTTYNIQNYGQYLFWLIIGMLPWIGFLPAACIDLYRKLKKKEELSIIIFGWLLIGLLSQSIIVEAAFAFMIAKQVIAYFEPNYPNENLVKSFSLLNLVFAFCAVTVLMLGGHEFFKDVGYRSAVSTTMVSWMPALLGAIGLFAKSRSMIIGGMTMSGLLFTLFFWLQLNPLIESSRSVPKRVVTETLKMSKESSIYLSGVPTNFDVYFNAQTNKAKRLFRDQNIADLVGKKNTVAIVNEEIYKALQPQLKKDKDVKLSGNIGWWVNPTDYYLLSK